MVATSREYQQQVQEAPRPPGLAYVLFFLLGTLAINTFYLVFEQEERRFWLWAGLAAGFAVSWLLPRTWRIGFHRIIDLGSVLTLVWFADAMTNFEEQSRFGNYLGQMVCVFLVLFSFRTFRHSDFSWLMVIAIVIMLLCSIPIFAASFIYSIFGFILLLTLALLTLNLYPAEGDHREEEPILTTPEWAGQFGRVLALSLGIFVLSAGLFSGLPQRISGSEDRNSVRSVFGVGSLSAETRGSLAGEDLEKAAGVTGSSAYSGFSENFDLTSGRSGAIQEDMHPILEVKAPGQPYMRALAWDVYTGRAWGQSAAAFERVALEPTLIPDYSSGRGNRDQFVLPGLKGSVVTAQAAAGELARAEIKLVGGTNTGKGFLFLPWQSVMVDGQFEGMSIDDMQTWKLLTEVPSGSPDHDRYSLGKGDTWTAIFRQPHQQHDVINQSASLSADEIARYTQLPETLPTSIRSLGREIVGETASPWDAGLLVQAYLRSVKRYSLNPPVMGSDTKDVVSYWLEQSEDGGHCELFATAAAVLLRTASVPCRVVTGFAPGSFNLSKGAWVIRGKDAHAWVEVFLPQRGWVALDPTPASWGEDISDSISDVTSRVSRTLEQYFIYDPRSFWTRDLPHHLEVAARQLRQTWSQVATFAQSPGAAGIANGWLWGLPLFSALILSVMSAMFWRFHVPWGAWAELRLRQTTHWSLARYDRLWRRLRRADGELPAGLTIAELSERVALDRPQLASALRELSEPFHRFHYEAPDSRGAWLDRLKSAWRNVRF